VNLARRRRLRGWNAIESFLKFESTAEDMWLEITLEPGAGRTSFAPVGPTPQDGPLIFARKNTHTVRATALKVARHAA
jgi:hypothetical protein